MRKMSWSVRKGSEAVSPVIATILLAGITVVLAATLYVMVFGFGANTNNPPMADFMGMSSFSTIVANLRRPCLLVAS